MFLEVKKKKQYSTCWPFLAQQTIIAIRCDAINMSVLIDREKGPRLERIRFPKLSYLHENHS